MPNTDTDACAAEVSFDQLRQEALKEFLVGVEAHPADAGWALARKLKRLDDAEKAAAERDEHDRQMNEAHHDHEAVTKLAFAMRTKLADTRKNRGGWWTEGCTPKALSQMLRAVVNKGDPVDVANYCAFLFAKGERIEPNRDLTDIPVKRLEDLDALNSQTYADPCAGDAYLQGMNNGIRLAHATIFDHEVDYIKHTDSVPVTDESGISVGAGTSRRNDLADALVYAHSGGSRTVDERVKGAMQRIAEKESAKLTATEVLRKQQAQERARDPIGTGAKEVFRRVAERYEEDQEAVNVPEPALSPVAQLSERIGLAPQYLVRAAEFAGELTRARAKFPTMASAHEGFAIIAEEMDELKAIVWQKQSERNYAELRKETVQLGAMVLAFLLEVVDPVNRR